MTDLHRLQLRAAAKSEGVLTGTLEYDATAQIGGLSERIRPGAFSPIGDVDLMVAHDQQALPLASTRGGTLAIADGTKALAIRARLDMSIEAHRAAHRAVDRGDIDSLSVGFVPKRITRAADGLRVIEAAELHEISLVRRAAYPQTSIEARTKMNEKVNDQGAAGAGQNAGDPAPETAAPAQGATGTQPEGQTGADLQTRGVKDVQPVDTSLVDGETLEIRRLQERASLAEAVRQVHANAQQIGAVAELQAARKLPQGGHELPWDLFQVRADTPGPDTSPSMSAMILGRVFKQSALDWIGARREMVPYGQRSYPVLTGGVAPASVGKGNATDQSAGTWETEDLKAKRIGASYLIRREDMAAFGPELETSLRMDLSAAIGEAMDTEVIGDGFIFKAAQPRIPAAAAEGNVDTFATYVAKWLDGVDGSYAVDESGIRMLVSQAVFKSMGSTFQANGDLSVASWARQNTGGIRVSANVPAPTNANVGEGLRVNAMLGSLVVPTWEGVGIIVDPYTNARTGKLQITAESLWNFAVVRPADFTRVSFKTA